jgi:hypothetical protein
VITEEGYSSAEIRERHERGWGKFLERFERTIIG